MGGETPPRAWGRLASAWRMIKDIGNTPTGVGKTAIYEATAFLAEKHPHGRGEDQQEPIALSGHGNTPTGVGKTLAQPQSLLPL